MRGLQRGQLSSKCGWIKLQWWMHSWKIFFGSSCAMRKFNRNKIATDHLPWTVWLYLNYFLDCSMHGALPSWHGHRYCSKFSFLLTNFLSINRTRPTVSGESIRLSKHRHVPPAPLATATIKQVNLRAPRATWVLPTRLALMFLWWLFILWLRCSIYRLV